MVEKVYTKACMVYTFFRYFFGKNLILLIISANFHLIKYRKAIAFGEIYADIFT